MELWQGLPASQGPGLVEEPRPGQHHPSGSWLLDPGSAYPATPQRKQACSAWQEAPRNWNSHQMYRKRQLQCFQDHSHFNLQELQQRFHHLWCQATQKARPYVKSGVRMYLLCSTSTRDGPGSGQRVLLQWESWWHLWPKSIPAETAHAASHTQQLMSLPNQRAS